MAHDLKETTTPGENEEPKIPGGGVREQIILEGKQIVGEIKTLPKPKKAKPPILDDTPAVLGVVEEGGPKRAPLADS